MKKQIFIPLLAILISTAILFGLSLGLSHIQEANAKAELEAKLSTLLPGSSSFTEEIYTGDDVNISKVYSGSTGFVIETTTAGYAGDITMLVGVNKDGVVTGLTVRDMSETAGLGAQALTSWKFLIQFLNSSETFEIGSNVDALTGATVTSKAVARSVNSAIAYVTGADTSSGATSWGG